MTLRLLLSSLCAMSIASSPVAQNQPAPDDPPAARADISDLSWLVGDWEGTDNVGDRVVERWLAPIGGVMVGTYVQTRRDDTGVVGVDWSEHLHLQETNGTLILTTLAIQAGFEAQDPIIAQKQAVAVEACRIAFKDLTLECADPAKPGSGLKVTYGEDFMNDGTGVFTVTYDKVGTYKKAGDD